MVLPKSKNAVGLGNSLMNDRFGKGKGADRKKVSTASQGGVIRTDANGQSYVTNAAKEASWVKMRSVTEQGALDEFLSTAELAGTDFTAEKLNNVKIIHTDQKNPYLLGANEERGIRKKHAQNKGRLTVPRRPKWDENTTPQQLDTQERESLLEWRRGLAELQENDDLLMTPFERNIEVWRQLWRVIERSDLVVQIVDARNPLLFRSADLESYVKEVNSAKKNLLLVNKADMMTEGQREAWADYFQSKGINYKFFSAHLAKEMLEGRDAEGELEERQNEQIAEVDVPEKVLVKNVQDLNLKDVQKQQENEDDDDDDDDDDDEEEDEDDDEEYITEEEDDSEEPESTPALSMSDRTRILTVEELEGLFIENSPTDLTDGRKTTIGLVGYPNVGKSSTINALIGAKKVSVSSTPGKTKHFQTIHLSDSVILCDCPGLVFPNFATTKAELVCSGILPIDQLREFTGPTGLVAQRIPQAFLENVYGIKINTRPMEEGGTGMPTAAELLRAYARARGFATTGQGQPDESRAARYVLKDYVNGKLLYCHPPPHDPEIDGAAFNAELYDFAHLPANRQAWLISHTSNDDDSSTLGSALGSPGGAALPLLPRETGPKSTNLDRKFFGPGSGNAAHLRMPFSHQYTEQGRARQLTGRKAKMLAALEKDVDGDGEARPATTAAKKHKKGARTKQRNARVEAPDEYDDASQGVFRGPAKQKV